MGAELSRRSGPPPKEPQGKVGEPGTAVGRRQQHDPPQLARSLHRERTAHHDGTHAVPDKMKPLDACVLVELSRFGRKLCRMLLDRAAQTWITPTDGAIALSRQRAPERLEQHGMCSMSMHEENGFAGHLERLARATS